MGKTQSTGGKNSKFGRASRRPSHNSYNLEQRWAKNKARRIAKQARKEAKKRDKLKSRKE